MTTPESSENRETVGSGTASTSAAQTRSDELEWRDVNYHYGPTCADSHKMLRLLREILERLEALEESRV